MADSEADIYELLSEERGATQAVDWIVRACQDRVLTAADEDTAPRLREEVLRPPVLFTKTIQVRGRDAKVTCEERGRRRARQAREAVVEVRAGEVVLRPPRRPDRALPPTRLNCVIVREVSPPAGEEPIEWILLTTLPIATAEQVRQVVAYYCVRWMIEFEPSEWQSVSMVVTKQEAPAQPPRLGEMVRLIAQLGGYVNYPKADPPGPQTIWIGLQRMYDLATGWETYGPGAQDRRERWV